MRPLLLPIAILGLLAMGGCGGDDEPDGEDAVTGTTGSQEAPVDDGLTAGEFIEAPLPDQAKEVQKLVDANPDCASVDAKPGGPFQVGVAITAAQSRPRTPLAEIVADQCGGG